MSEDLNQMKAQLEGVKQAYESDYSKLIDESLAEGFGGLKKRIKGMDIHSSNSMELHLCILNMVNNSNNNSSSNHHQCNSRVMDKIHLDMARLTFKF